MVESIKTQLLVSEHTQATSDTEMTRQHAFEKNNPEEAQMNRTFVNHLELVVASKVERTRMLTDVHVYQFISSEEGHDFKQFSQQGIAAKISNTKAVYAMYLNKIDKDKDLKEQLVKLYQAHQLQEQSRLMLLAESEMKNEQQADLTSFYGVKNVLMKKKPFPRLPSIISIAIVLSYYDYESQVQRLMCKLSRVTQAHFIGHRGALHQFLRPHQLYYMPYFGQEKPIDIEKVDYFEWPKYWQSAEISRDMRLRKLSVRVVNGQALQGIQVAHGPVPGTAQQRRSVASPSMQGQMGSQGTKKLDYAINGDIQMVAMKVASWVGKNGADQEYTGIRLLDESNKILLDQEWGSGRGSWQVQVIPEQRKLVGFYGYFWNDYQIHMIGLITTEK